MELKITSTEIKTEIALIGSLDGETSGKCVQDILAACKNSAYLEINMEQCDYISSAGLRALLIVGKSVKTASGHMKLLNMCGEIADIMTMTGFEGLFKGLE